MIFKLAVIPALLICSTLSAEILSFEARDAPFEYRFNIEGITSDPGGRFSNMSTESYIRVSVDTDNLLLTIDEARVTFGDSTNSFSANVTTGFGTSADLDFDLRARPFEFAVLGGQPSALTPTTAGNFSPQGFRSASSISADPIQIDYDISSPTDRVIGTTIPQPFSQSVMFATLDTSGELRTSGFPNSINLNRLQINVGNTFPRSVTVNETIDGNPFSFDIRTGFFQCLLT